VYTQLITMYYFYTVVQNITAHVTLYCIVVQDGRTYQKSGESRWWWYRGRRNCDCKQNVRNKQHLC